MEYSWSLVSISCTELYVSRIKFVWTAVLTAVPTTVSAVKTAVATAVGTAVAVEAAIVTTAAGGRPDGRLGHRDGRFDSHRDYPDPAYESPIHGRLQNACVRSARMLVVHGSRVLHGSRRFAPGSRTVRASVRGTVRRSKKQGNFPAECSRRACWQ